MKKLFLSSVAYLTLDKITELLPDHPSKLKLAFIPTAANLYTQKEWLYKDREKLVDMGFKVKDLDIDGKSKEFLQNELKNVDVVFVSGGNSYYLLEKVNESGFGEIIKELISKGVVYIGSSAGSVITCPTIAMVEDLDDIKDAPGLKSFKGLNLVDFLIFVHYGQEDCKKEYETINKNWVNKGYEIKYLTNSQALVVDGDKCKLIEV
jgi:dipeptidase E